MEAGVFAKYSSLVILACVILAAGEEELHTFRFRYHNQTVHGVADVDSDQNWIAHHVFASKLGPGITVARDERVGIEVFRFSREAVCYARPITKDTRNVWQIKAILQVLDERGNVLEPNKKAKREYLECTGTRISHDRLGNVAYLCKGVPVYTLRPTAQTMLLSLPRVENKGLVQAEEQGWCFLCTWGGCGRRRRSTMKSICLVPRVVFIKPCTKAEQ